MTERAIENNAQDGRGEKRALCARLLQIHSVRHAAYLLPLLALFAPLLAQAPISYGTGVWARETLGNHRAVVRVDGKTDAAWVHLDWRRRDLDPAAKEVLVVDAATGKTIANVARVAITRDAGDLIFQPVSGPGEYWIYFLPYVDGGRANYPKVTYPPPSDNADAAWLLQNHAVQPGMPRAEVVAFQSVDDFDRFTSMELIATREEVNGLLKKHPDSGYFVFPEDRRNSIRMTGDIPAEWAQRGPGAALEGVAARGEFYAFQLGVWAARTPLKNVRVRFDSIPGFAFRCFNLGGIDWEGHPFSRILNVDEGKIQPVWCGVQVPTSAAAGNYAATIRVSADGQPATPVALRLTVTPKLIRNAGDDDPQNLSRLRWLDSTLAEDDDVVAPYTPVEVKGQRIGVLGRDVLLAPSGLPSSISSHFSINMTGYSRQPRAVLSGPIEMVIEDARHNVLKLTPKPLLFTKKAEGVVAWEVAGRAGPLSSRLKGSMEFDGSLDYTVEISAREATEVADIRLEIPIAADVARYAMGLGLRGGNRPDHYEWKWKVEHNQDGAWIGDVNAGLQFSLRDDKYSRPLNTNFYLSKPLIMPASWDNGGKGGCRLGTKDASTYLVTCYSGARTLAAGETQHYNLRLLLTPFHSIDTRSQFTTRFYHAYKPLAEIAATGANTVNIHHATAINPYINYPFLRPNEMKAYIDDAHARGMKVKIYDTVRELTNRAPELFALLSLGDEIIARGPGAGPSWLQEHIDTPYIPGWYVPELHDAALVTTGTSRWHNFYVEGLRWLVENVGIDGLYLDDIAFDRTTMKRVRKVLVRGNPGALIDVHSANQFNPRDGFANSANLYLEHFPFIDRLWFGEYFDYNSPPDLWLVEMSGIPFGLMGEMLQDGGNPWRAMIYGMTNRLPWAGDPRPIWRFWDEYDIAHKEMLGYWVPDSPVKTGREDILATSYRGKGQTLVALASWAKDASAATLQIDWHALGIDPGRATISAPAIEKFQEGRSFKVGEGIPVEPGKGWLLVISER
jgi:hypothetical protein